MVSTCVSVTLSGVLGLTFGFVTGIYYFSYTHNGLTSGFGAVIKHNNVPKTPESYVTSRGAASIETVIACARDDRVMVEVTSLPGSSTRSTRNQDNTLTGFVGYMIHSLSSVNGL